MELRVGSETVGFGSTDRNGNYNIRWETNDNTTPASITVRWILRHKDTRFSVTNASNGVWTGDIDSFTPIAGDAVWAGEANWGFTQVNNLYDGAQRTWWEALRYSSVQLNGFNAVNIRWPDPDGAPTGIAQGSNNRILFFGDVARIPQVRISHEMGHIAAFVAMGAIGCGAYNYPNACSSSNPFVDCTDTPAWNVESPEHYCAAFDEAIADFLGGVSYYWFGATEPRHCPVLGLCNDVQWDLEQSLASQSTSVCTEAVRRSSRTTLKYLWDAYDSVNDANYNDAVGHSYDQMHDALDAFPSGFGNGDVFEAFSSVSPFPINDEDGRSALDYSKVLPNSTLTQFQNNCIPGDD